MVLSFHFYGLFFLLFFQIEQILIILLFIEKKNLHFYFFSFSLFIFCFPAILYIILTFWNNYRFKHFLQKEKQYDAERVDVRRKLINQAYDERFGTKDFRHNVCFYSVKEEQNLETDFVKKLYQKGENND